MTASCRDATSHHNDYIAHAQIKLGSISLAKFLELMQWLSGWLEFIIRTYVVNKVGLGMTGIERWYLRCCPRSGQGGSSLEAYGFRYFTTLRQHY
jgi:hypothetical protein